jgi:hypothetical protein
LLEFPDTLRGVQTSLIMVVDVIVGDGWAGMKVECWLVLVVGGEEKTLYLARGSRDLAKRSDYRQQLSKRQVHSAEELIE